MFFVFALFGRNAVDGRVLHLAGKRDTQLGPVVDVIVEIQGQTTGRKIEINSS
jgi:hypothetical protein